jgi:NAD(P)-dependent dehydrogenase (short-subunit alcohol dehydrogenase family)
MTDFSSQAALLDEHVALVVGGGRGIGAATAVLLGRAGAAVAVVARTGSEVRHVGERVRAEGREVMSSTLDVRIPEQVEHVVDQILGRFGRLDHVIYCAGHVPDAAFVWDVDPQEVRAAIEVNAIGPVLLARQVVPVMLEQGEGNLVFVSSVLPNWPIPGLGAYSASRAAENVLVQTLAAEVRGSGVRVDVFAPPPTETSALRRFRAGLPGRRAAVGAVAGEDPNEVAQAILWLCLPPWQRVADGAGRRSYRRSPRRGLQELGWRYPW